MVVEVIKQELILDANYHSFNTIHNFWKHISFHIYRLADINDQVSQTIDLFRERNVQQMTQWLADRVHYKADLHSNVVHPTKSKCIYTNFGVVTFLPSSGCIFYSPASTCPFFHQGTKDMRWSSIYCLVPAQFYSSLKKSCSQ